MPGGSGLFNGVSIFSEDGRYLACGNRGVAVLVANIIAVQERLAKVGMGWKALALLGLSVG
jgi:hypothetical protein